MRKAVQIALGLLAGALVGILATIVHAGPVDMPIAGLALASGMVAAGAWFMVECGWVTAWFAASVGVAGAAVWLLMYPPNNDSFVSTDQWVSQLWLFLAPVSAIVPAGWALARRGDKGKDPS